MNNLYKIIIGVFVGFCACFILCDKASAIPQNATTRDGFAMCTYTSTDEFYDRQWVLYAWAFYDQNDTPHTGISLVYKSSDTAPEKEVFLLDYKNKYRNNETMIETFRKNNLWNCPTYAYLEEDRNGGFLGIGSKSSFELDEPYAKDVRFVKYPHQGASGTTGGIIDMQAVSWGKVTSQLDGAVLNPTNADEAPAGSGSTADSNGDSMSSEQVQDHNNMIDSNDLPSIEDIEDYYNSEQSGSNYSNDSGDCNLIDDDLKNLLNTIFTWISIGGIILVIVMTCVSGIKVITGTEDAIKDFAKGLKVRIICLVVLLLAPVIVNFAIQTVNGIGNIAGVNQDDPLCGVGK